MIDTRNKELFGYTFIDLFAGIGGFRLGLESLGTKCVFSSEINLDAKETYKANFEDYPNGDIRTIKEEDIPNHDILCAGFPCQSFSAGGKKLGFADSRGTLFFEVARIVNYRKPQVVFLENVMYLVEHDGGRTLSVIEATIRELGYSFYYQIFNSADYGVPQQRKRTYMVCFRNDLGITSFCFPFPIPLRRRIKDILIHEEELLQPLYRERDIYPPKRKPRTNTNEVILYGFFHKGRQGERVYRTNGVSITIETCNKGYYLVSEEDSAPLKIRKLHQRECARLMGFPDSFKLHSNAAVAYRQLGNSVVVDVIQYIAISIARALRHEGGDLFLTP
jgi:DNA (cytosine-5)-methyltransferase 1